MPMRQPVIVWENWVGRRAFLASDVISPCQEEPQLWLLTKT